jgi:hypothetical protein
LSLISRHDFSSRWVFHGDSSAAQHHKAQKEGKNSFCDERLTRRKRAARRKWKGTAQKAGVRQAGARARRQLDGDVPESQMKYRNRNFKLIDVWL